MSDAIKATATMDIPKVPSKENENTEDTTTSAPVTNPWGETESPKTEKTETTSTTSAPEVASTVKTIGQETDDDSLLKGCIVHFQTQPIGERSPEFTAPFELNLKVPTTEICAHRCYQV